MTTINIDLNVQQPLAVLDVAAGQAVLVPKNSALDLSKVEELVAAAAASETAAGEYAQTAQGSAATASEHAQSARESASAAQEAALKAQTEAEAAEESAEEARTESQAAKAAAETSQSAIVAAQEHASTAQTAAENAEQLASDAENASESALAAVGTAQASATTAQAAQSESQQAAAAAAGSAVNAKASETAALAASQAAQVSAVTVNEAVAVAGGHAQAAKGSADTASEQALAAKGSATTASQQAQAAQNSATTANEKAQAASESATTAGGHATTAQASATTAQASAQAAAKSLSDMALTVGGVTQQAINDSLEFKKSSLENKTIAQMLVFNNVDFDKDEAITTQVSSPSNRHFKSNGHTLTQTAQRTSNLVGGYDKDNITIEGFNFIQDKTSAISGGIANDHQMSKFYGGKYNRLIGNKYDGQFAISFAYGSASLPDRTGQFGLAAFNEATDLQGMFIETIGSQYNRIIGNALDSVTKGQQHGIRLSGYDKINNPSESTHAPNFGQVGVANVFRRIANGVSAQNSSKYSNLSAMHFTDVDACIHASLGTVPLNDPSMHRFDFTAHNVRKLANLQYLNHTKLGFHVDGSSFTSVGIDELTGRTGTGFNHYEGMIRNSAATAMTNRYSHNLYNLQIDTSNADGAVIAGNYGGGTIIANACNTCVSVLGNYNNLTVVATGGVFNALAVGGVGNVINIQTDGNAAVSGNGNTIIGRIGGNLTVTGSDNKFIGEVVGTVSRGSGTGNKYSDLKGWSDTIVMPAITTTAGGRITLTVAKHASAQIRNIFATIPLNANGWTSKVISISGAAVIFEFYNAAGALLNAQPVTFNYAYVCS